MTGGRRAATMALLAAAWLAPAAPALADPPGPTDYQTEVIRLDPDPGGIRIDVIGGDSFILLAADPGLTVEVIGYEGEPYLRFLPDGTVEENRASPTTYLNFDRYGVTEVPAGVSADDPPEWTVVATDGSYAWHDHRTHWMNEARPPGREPGDVILEGVVPLVVDGAEVDLMVRSTWLPPPSPAMVLAGMALALAAVAAAALRGAGTRALALLVAALAVPAAVVGIAAVVTVPPETAPSWALWVPPLAAVVLAAAAALAPTARQRAASSAALLGAVLLAVWGIVHREWMLRAVLPTGAPFWAERLVTGAVLVGAAGLILLLARAQVADAAPRRP
ncbi:MAG: hypothetical protein KQH83_07460 [Actinobacteria bacterium]|nr:hypothetical protein [Actinomycetota bacterium]